MAGSFDNALNDASIALSLDFTSQNMRLLCAAWLMECQRFTQALVHYRFVCCSNIRISKNIEMVRFRR